ncbi:MAG TPA: hypothetical protein VGN30_03625 [Steroidobacteraceae bacterium]
MAIHSEPHASPRHLGEPWRLPDVSNWVLRDAHAFGCDQLQATGLGYS